MKIQLGIYEIFSRIVPGSVYMAAVIHFLVIAGLMKIDLNSLADISLLASLGLALAAYILGGAFDNLALILFRLFKRPGYSIRSFLEFKRLHQNRWHFDFNEDDWPLMLAYIRTKNLELAGEIDRHSAISIMSRNIGAGLAMLSVNFVIQTLISGNFLYLLISLLFLILSVLIFREAVKFRGWFYKTIYETLLAYRLDLEEIITAKPASGQKKKTRHEPSK